jgi:hypothetical protein
LILKAYFCATLKTNKMKKIITLVSVASMLALVSCGPSAAEKAKIAKDRLDSIAGAAKARIVADSTAKYDADMKSKMVADSTQKYEDKHSKKAKAKKGEKKSGEKKKKKSKKE